MEKSEENHSTASLAADSETDGEDSAFWEHEDLEPKRKTGKTN
jgi:hypothetical protein